MDARGNWTKVALTYDEALARLPELLQKEGFGVITRIDLKETFRAKLGVDFRRYTILGACNPKFALEAVSTEPHAGLLLPCNVVVYELEDGQAEIGIIDPIQQLDAAGSPLEATAREVRARLERVAEEVKKS